MQHLAGDAVKIGNHVVQRCLICGYRMDFTDLNRIMVCDSGGDNSYSTFKLGGIYEVDGNRTSLVGELTGPEINPSDYPDLCFHKIHQEIEGL